MSNILKIAGAGVSAAAEETDEYFNQTVLLLHGDGSDGAQNNEFLDSGTANSGGGFTVVRNPLTGPNAPTQGTFSPFSAPDGRWSVYLDGSSDVSFPSDAAFDFGTGSWQVECWIYPTTSVTTAVQAIMTRQEPSTDQAFNFRILNTGKLDITLRANGGTNLTQLTSTNSIVANTWTHVAVSFNSATGTVELFINGSSEGTTPFSYNLTPDTARNFRIGVLDTTGSAASSYFTGYISNVRVLKGGFTYSGSYTVPTAPLPDETNTVLLTVQSNRFVDNSSGLVATPRGTPKVTPFSPFAPTAAYSPSVNGGSAYLDGTGDYLTVANNSAFDFGSGAFCVDAWVYSNSGNTSFLIFGSWDTANAASREYAFSASAGVIKFWIYDSGNTFREVLSGGTVVNDTWQHLVACRDGSNNWALFVDGVRVATSGQTYTIRTLTNSYYIGRYINDVLPLNGYVSGLRVVKGDSVYDPTQTTITIPTAPPTNITNTSLLLNFTNAGIFDNTGKNNLETVADAQIDTTVKKYGTGSMEFDGTGDYLLSPATPEITLGTGDFTIEMWLQFSTVSVSQLILDMRPASTQGAYPTFYMTTASGSPLLIWFANGAPQITSSAVVAGSWYHLAISRNNGNTKLYVNGVQAGSTYFDSTNYLCSRLVIGAQSFTLGSTSLNGYIEDLRITKGVARYTTTFTPPDKAFPDL